MRNEGQRILVIDDDPLILDLTADMLAELGYSWVDRADNGKSALERIDNCAGAYDLILCDLEMPEMDGIELMRHLGSRAFKGGIALMTGIDCQILDKVMNLGKAHALGMMGILHKPVSLAALHDLLQNRCTELTEKQSQTSENPDITADQLAWALDSDAFKLVFQPQVDANSGHLIGVEALVRWDHPCLGLVFPGQFIDHFERSGLIDLLSSRVMKLALEQGADWRAKGIELDIALNLSMQNLMDLNLPDQLFALAGRLGFPLKFLTIELTESQLALHPPSALEILTRLRMKGVSLSIDDFGTGYANLEQLREFPFTELKIDRSFVANAKSNPVAMEILKTTASLGKKLNLRLVAEGVETNQQLELVRQTGYDLVQGYYIAKPMPAAALEEWLEQWQGFAEMETAAAPLP